uniref:Uncharacterized protein n=1 Tax=Rhizophora mucronata TaxID=61149 RepID=A0A2P2IJI1_RHIMU
MFINESNKTSKAKQRTAQLQIYPMP